MPKNFIYQNMEHNKFKVIYRNIAICRECENRHADMSLDERAELVGLTPVLYRYYLDKGVKFETSLQPRELNLLHGECEQVKELFALPTINVNERPRHRECKYHSDLLCAQTYHKYLLGEDSELSSYLFWYYVERHKQLYGVDNQYTAVFNGNQQRVVALMQLRGEKSYRSAP